MSTLDRMKEIEASLTADPWVADNIAPVWNELRNALPKLLAVVEAGDILATHVSGILALNAVGTPETTKGWLGQYLKARAEL